MSYSLTAFIILLLFYLGVLAIMSDPQRVLTGTEHYGSRAVIVDAQGNGNYTTIQAALNAAHSQSPASDARWLVRVAPGDYQESLTLYDYIDITGMAPGYTAHLVSPSNQAAISNGAETTISNLRISGVNDPLIQTGASFSGTMRFINCITDYGDEEVTLLQAVSGSVEIRGCSFKTGGKTIYVTAGTVKAYDSVLHHYNDDAGATAEATIEIAGTATLDIHRCSILNSALSGGAAIKITAAPASARFHHCLFRKASGSYSIDTSVTPTVHLGACTANAGIHTSISGTHDLQTDSNY